MKRYEPNQQKTTDKFNKTNKRVYGTIIYPKIERHETDIYIDVISEDRVDNLAYQYYGDVNLWWYIASVNNLKSNNIEAGTQLRVPVSTEQANIK